MEKIEISVIIPTFNRKETVCDAVNSVLSQTAIQFIKEIIVIDDGSTDGTEIKMQKYTNIPLIKYYKQTNRGVSSARNTGIYMSTGNWIALLDSDDEWTDKKIEEQVKLIEQHPEIDFLGCSANNQTLRIGLKKIDFLYKARVIDLCIKFFPATSSMIFKKEIFEEIGGFNENQKYAEDGEFCLRICAKYNYFYSPLSLVDFGHGKKAFDGLGLCANLKEMHLGNINNLKMLKEHKIINSCTYILLLLFFILKYYRRIIIVNFRKLCK